MPAKVYSKSPEALLSFTTNTATTVLPCKYKNQKRNLPPLNEFIEQVFKKSKLSPCVCLVSLIYLNRLKLGLPSHAHGDTDTPYRLFIAAILIASKFLSETGTCLTSQAIVVMTNHVYTPKDINQMERSFLGLIKYDLFVNVQSIKDYLNIHGETLEMDLVEEVLDHNEHCT